MAPPVKTWIRPNRSPPSRCICSFHVATAAGLTPGSGMWEPSRKTTRRPNVQRMRLRSSGILKMFWNDCRICNRLLLFLGRRLRGLRLGLGRRLAGGDVLLRRGLVMLDRRRVDRTKLLDRPARLGDLLLGALGERLGLHDELLGQVPSRGSSRRRTRAAPARGLSARSTVAPASNSLLELAHADDLVVGLEELLLKPNLGGGGASTSVRLRSRGGSRPCRAYAPAAPAAGLAHAAGGPRPRELVFPGQPDFFACQVLSSLLPSRRRGGSDLDSRRGRRGSPRPARSS